MLAQIYISITYIHIKRDGEFYLPILEIFFNLQTANPVKFTIDTVTVAQMTSYTVANDVFSGHDVKKFYILLGYNKVSNYRYTCKYRLFFWCSQIER